MLYNFLGSLLGAFCSSLMISVVAGHYFILFLRQKIASLVRENVPERHAIKNGTPSMGGLYMLAVIIINTLIWCGTATRSVWLIIGSMLAFGAIGLADDLCKQWYRKGLSARIKFIAQWTTAFASIVFFVHGSGLTTIVTIPGWYSYSLDLSLLFYVWSALIMVSASNAVNLTDGLDGLATTVYIPCMLFFMLFFGLLCTTSIDIFNYFTCHESSLLALLAATIAGTTSGFLWHNTYPAQLFMGDAGSLSLGAGLAALALFAKAELLLPLLALVFVAEVVSVILQVFWVKKYQKRLFRMTPIHHHFELSGMAETTIVSRAGLITLAIALFISCIAIYRFR